MVIGRTGKNDRPDSLRAMNRTFIICKPDAVERGLVGQILARFESGTRPSSRELANAIEAALDPQKTAKRFFK